MASLPPPDARAIPATAGDYPAGLRDLADPPAVLHVRGGPVPPLERAVAIVGSRAATDYGIQAARRLAGDLARLGLVVVSGLARGIDAAAHTGALDAGGTTVAVLPGGLDAIAPAHHAALAERIRARGALASEYPDGTPVFRGSFIRRNRLIAALSAATVVVEAATKSGALSTATAARRLGRVVLAVPGDVDRETSRGCHALLRNGAWVCEGAADVLAALRSDVLGKRGEGSGRSSPRLRASREPGIGGARPGGEDLPLPSPRPSENETVETRVLSALSLEPRLVEAVATAAGLTIAETLGALLTLQWSGLAAARAGGRWARA